MYAMSQNENFTAVSDLSNEEASEVTADSEIIDSNRYYKISREGLGTFRYQIYDEAGDMIEEGITYRLAPKIKPIENEHLVEVEIGVGTGTRQYIYFDTKEDTISEVFDNAHFLGGRLIAIVLRQEEDNVLVLRDIFSVEDYFYEIKREFSEFAVYANAVTAVSPVDSAHVNVHYFKGIATAAEEVSEIISVPTMPN
jgi:hypothetical protein